MSATSATRSVGGDGKRTIIEVPVEDGENRIRITGTNEFGYLTERSVVALAKTRKEETRKGKLYLIAIGVEKYPLLPTDCNGRSCDLRYPVDDAAELVRVIAERSGPLYAGMETLVLVNREALDETPDKEQALSGVVALDDILEPDSDTISDEIEDFLDKPGPDDTTIVFVAGHGINVDEDYYFIPSDGRKQDPEKWKRSSLVDWSDIQKAVERAEGVRFMLLDTCHAANAFNPRLEKDAADARIVVFSATAANSTAAELPELGHGVFTYSVLQGLLGAANSSGDGIRLLGLADYIYREVIRLTGSRSRSRSTSSATWKTSCWRGRDRERAVAHRRPDAFARFAGFCSPCCCSPASRRRRRTPRRPVRRARTIRPSIRMPARSRRRSARSPTIGRRTSGCPASPCRITCWPTGWWRSA